MPEVGEGQWSHGISSVSLIHGVMSVKYSCSGNVHTASDCLVPAFSSRDWVSFVTVLGDVLMTRATLVVWETENTRSWVQPSTALRLKAICVQLW